MSSSYNSYRSSSAVPTHSSHYRAPSNYSDLASPAGGSERAEFHDRYQNRVNRKQQFAFF
jgi:hypothetical protein